MSDGLSDIPLIIFSSGRVASEFDCACAASIVKGQGIVQDVPDCACALSEQATLVHLHEPILVPLPGDYMLAFDTHQTGSVFVMNEPAFREYQALSTDFPSRKGRETQTIPNTVLTAWLHVTNACNLRCTYCYVNKTEESMDEATGLAAVDAVIRSALRQGFKAIKLKYAGGEATLNFRLIKSLHSYAKEQTAVNGLGLQEVILSNGVGISAAMLEFMRDADMHLMISLDGLGADHDEQRIFRDGSASSTFVTKGIDQALAYGIRPHLSVTVTRHNATSIASIVAFALKRNLFFNLNFYRDHNTIISHEAWAAEDEQLIAGVKAAFYEIEKQLPTQSLIANLVDRTNFAVPHEHPCGAGNSYLVIDHKGHITSCQMELGQGITDVEDPDPLQRIRLQTHSFQNITVEDKEGCRECEWRYWCAGGCPLLTYRATGRNDVKSPYCHVYKALFPELLRLEGLRLLKWADTPPQ